MSPASPENRERPGEGPAGRRARSFLTGSQFFRNTPPGARSAIAVIWLAFVVFPVINAIAEHGTVLQHGLTIAGAALFVAAYVGIVATWRPNRANPVTVLLFVAMLVLASALTLGQSSGWGFLFIYCSACVWIVVPKQFAVYLMLLCAALAGGISAIGGADGGTAIGFFASGLGVGLLMLLMSDLRMRNHELSEARAELADLAVTQERERFARDLHDLLGHSLSVITLKAELAGRMLTERPADAAREVAELEQVARTALSEVREAVSGYHQPTLDGELAGARMALSAAGIHADVQQARVSLAPAVEAVLAWAVREGATNVIRHSGARHCTLRVSAGLTDASVEVTDDGVHEAPDDGVREAPDDGVREAPDGVLAAPDSVLAAPVVRRGEPAYGHLALAGSNGSGAANGSAGRVVGGHGLAGLAERARLVNGTLEAGALATGGYRLAVIIPVART
jgi:two-component system sensor histidine kinase DesK